MKLPRLTPKFDGAYITAAARASFLWDRLDTTDDPRTRQDIYDALSAAYAAMAGSGTAGQAGAGYDGDLTADLGTVSRLCQVLGTSEYALACDPGDRPGAPVDEIPGAARDALLTAAWRLFCETSDRAVRAALLRGHHGRPARRGEQRQPEGIIPLTTRYAGSAVTGFLEHVADTEASLARQPTSVEAAR